LILPVFRFDVRAGIAFNTENVKQRLFRTEEAMASKTKLSRQHLLSAGHFLWYNWPFHFRSHWTCMVWISLTWP